MVIEGRIVRLRNYGKPGEFKVLPQSSPQYKGSGYLSFTKLFSQFGEKNIRLTIEEMPDSFFDREIEKAKLRMAKK